MSELPILLLDVDGVLNPFPKTPAGFSEYEFFPEDDEPVRLCADHAEWLRELARSFEISWASAWGEAANHFICHTFRLPPLPVVVLPPPPFEPREKVPAVAAFVGERSAAWVDDVVTEEARAWAAARPEPTLLVEVPPASGLTRDHVDHLQAWVDGLRNRPLAGDAATVRRPPDGRSPGSGPRTRSRRIGYRL